MYIVHTKKTSFYHTSYVKFEAKTTQITRIYNIEYIITYRGGVMSENRGGGQ
jgi:hypothetical protein